MADLSVKYMGLALRNPIIVGSSGLTNSVDNIIELEKAGAGAVVLKSLFEEHVRYYLCQENNSGQGIGYPEALEYISRFANQHPLEEYLKLIAEAKRSVKIPVIASINCVSASEWISFANKIEEAGADALELNIFILPSDTLQEGEENEAEYFNIIQEVIRHVNFPVAIKIGCYFSGFSRTALKLSWTGIKGMVLFNRFYSPDIDIDNLTITAGGVFSTKDEYLNTLRWVSMLSARLYCDVSATTGIHDAKTVIKHLLAGAKTVQVCTILYKQGFEHLGILLAGLDEWMMKHIFTSTDQFIGKMSMHKSENPAVFERVQFMRQFSGIE